MREGFVRDSERDGKARREAQALSGRCLRALLRQSSTLSPPV